jgi:Cytochrome c7 and related cytochrome c
MSALFRRRSNTTFRAILVAAAAAAGGALTAILVFQRLPAGNNQLEELAQPVLFDHRHHILDDGVDCRYCHLGAERGASAGIPSTALCMNCHAQIWNKSPRLEPVRKSYFTGRPIAWVRVHQVPDFVYFNHSIHVAKGVGCETCHGRVDRMAAILQVQPLTMGWCLDCHRDPAPNLRPPEAITAMGWTPEGDAAALGRELLKRYDVHARVSCTTCHR